jgi:tetratricopeptide (TPR) repeat protein
VQHLAQPRLAELLLAGALAVCALAAHQTNRVLERYGPMLRDPAHIGPLPDGRVLRVLSLGFERIVADLFWLRTVYYIGDEQVHKAGYPDAARLARLVTDIDPGFTSAYVHLNSVLTVLRPEPEAAIELLHKAERHGIDYWRIYFLQGFNYFFYRNDYEGAARYLERAALGGGPEYLPLLASRLYAHSGELDTPIELLRARLEEIESEKVRRRLQARLRNLLIARDKSAIDAAIEAYRRRRGAPPSEVAALVAAGLLREVPLDPAGRPYQIRDGRAFTSVRHRPVTLAAEGAIR